MVRPNTPKGLCLRCKGSRYLCGKKPCPILTKYSVLKSIKLPTGMLQDGKNADIFSASPPSFFVGHVGYPRVAIGPMVPHSLDSELDITRLDAPEKWLVPGVSSAQKAELMDIVRFRSTLVRTIYKTPVKGPAFTTDKILSLSQEIAMAEKPVGTEVNLEKVHVNVELDNHAPPTGPVGNISKLKITENPKVHQKVEYAVSDNDLKANEAITKYLYSDGHLAVTDITRILSAGLLGVKKDRKLVPTRWSITATDDMVSKHLIHRIKMYPELGEFYLHEAEYLGNNFYIILVPRPWVYEMMESWSPHSIWRSFDTEKTYVIVQDHELSNGRKKYASNITGAYYAARLGVCEYLERVRRQAAVMIIREVNEQYLMPLGVWVIRQAVRDAMSNKPSKHSSLKEIFIYLNKKLQVPLKFWLKKSKLLPYIRKQRTLHDFIR